MEIDLKQNREEFDSLLRSTEREGIEDVISDLENLGFYEAPASAGHHLNTPADLCSILSTPARLRWRCMKA